MHKKHYQCWVKKQVSSTQWDNWYSKNEFYALLSKDSVGVWIGFLTADECPEGCQLADAVDARKIHNWRSKHNLRPLPFDDDKFDDYKEETEEHKKSVRERINKMREWIIKQVWWKN